MCSPRMRASWCLPSPLPDFPRPARPTFFSFLLSPPWVIGWRRRGGCRRRTSVRPARTPNLFFFERLSYSPFRHNSSYTFATTFSFEKPTTLASLRLATAMSFGAGSLSYKEVATAMSSAYLMYLVASSTVSRLGLGCVLIESVGLFASFFFILFSRLYLFLLLPLGLCPSLDIPLLAFFSDSPFASSFAQRRHFLVDPQFIVHRHLPV